MQQRPAGAGIDPETVPEKRAKALTPEERHALRQETAVPLFEKLRTWLMPP